MRFVVTDKSFNRIRRLDADIEWLRHEQFEFVRAGDSRCVQLGPSQVSPGV